VKACRKARHRPCSCPAARRSRRSAARAKSHHEPPRATC
jgi:hypothetical protein